MREFKFRVWDTKSKVMLDWFGIMQEAFNRDGSRLLYDVFTRIHEHWIIQQFTGLKTKNGREIYEGDILESPMPDFNNKHLFPDNTKYEYSWWERGTVTYYPELARFGLNFCSPFGGEGYTGKEQHISEYLEDWKLIGNVFENPELLK